MLSDVTTADAYALETEEITVNNTVKHAQDYNLAICKLRGLVYSNSITTGYVHSTLNDIQMNITILIAHKSYLNSLYKNMVSLKIAETNIYNTESIVKITNTNVIDAINKARNIIKNNSDISTVEKIAIKKKINEFVDILSIFL